MSCCGFIVSWIGRGCHDAAGEEWNAENGLFDRNRDLLGFDRRIERHVGEIGQKEL